jgi:hypothetical protein
MEQKRELTLEQALTSELSTLLLREPWCVVDDPEDGQIQMRGRVIEVSGGKIILSQICRPDELSLWENNVHIETDKEQAIYSWWRDGVFKIDRPLELQAVIDEIRDLVPRDTDEDN